MFYEVTYESKKSFCMSDCIDIGFGYFVYPLLSNVRINDFFRPTTTLPEILREE